MALWAPWAQRSSFLMSDWGMGVSCLKSSPSKGLEDQYEDARYKYVYIYKYIFN
ncbi:rCG41712, partial [Rattus norvegicus]